MKPPPLDRRVLLRIGLHRDKDGEPTLSIGQPDKKVTRLVRRRPKPKPGK